ncbi:conjugal transfer protein TrbL [Phenylobacterium sp. Root77]|uniref:P-type conjugative transfer protein TrbL n=1 Tax=unclassified Phenylobacterium TaxID=2640670 RepID=UPI0006F8C1F0|nr:MULTISPECIES: P-type conjugative transfer protein TrbL [unclassified Phenylobacterium]KQW72222.1 conjugal transfer protein TrbL [Phenylobacterium sp. Root1277]KQW95142.1 conjugal transfer protein TrbL [Phenylobacterium sp. Root1290]KRC44835.1 conjugal transfer protein TrbL [Phenylobacterium sp. Root77]
MNPGVADRFLNVFTTYIDSGFGLVGGEVAFLATTLVVIDMTLAALFWAWSPGEEILARLVKKTLYVGAFAFILSNFNALARIIFESFSGLGLQAGGGGMAAGEFLRPGRLGQAGIEAGQPILEAAQQMSGFPAVFDNLPQIAVLLLAWLVVVLAFFVLAVQLFVTLVEFKLTTLAGFILVPFGLFGRTAFLAERVLGNVMASGVKVLVLAVIVGIGSSLFDEFIQDFGGLSPSLEEVLSLALASLCLLGLGVFGPGIASGLVSGGPQLGAGAAVGTGLAAGGIAAAGAVSGRLLAGSAVGAARSIVNAIRKSPSAPGGGAPPGGGPRPASAAAGTAGSSQGGQPPAWARRLQQRHAAGDAASTATHALRSGDQSGGGASVSLSEERS